MQQDILLNQKIVPLFVKYCVPSVFGMVGISLYILADTFFVANGVGELGLAALNIILPVFNIVFSIGLLLGIGGASFSAVEKGRALSLQSSGGSTLSNRIFSFCVSIGFIIGCVFSLCGLFFPKTISLLLGSTPLLLPYCTEYAQIVMAFSPAFIVNNILLAFLRNDHKPKLAMVSMIAGSLFNIVMDYFAIYVWGLGMFGAGLATGFSPIVGILIMSTHFLSKKCSYWFHLARPNFSFLRPIFSGGTASFIIEITVGIVIFIFNLLILKVAGNLGVAAYGIVVNIALVFSSIFTGIGQAIQPIVSVNFGAKNWKRMKQVYFCGAFTAVLFGVLGYLLLICMPDAVIGIFNNNQNPELLSLAKQGFYLYFITLIPMGVNIVSAAFFQSVLELRSSGIISLSRGFVVIGIFSIAFAFLFGLPGIWISAPAAETVTLLLALWFLKSFLQGIHPLPCEK